MAENLFAQSAEWGYNLAGRFKVFQQSGRDKPRELLTDSEVRELLRVSRTTLWRLRRTSRIPYSKIGGRYRYQREDVLQWLARSLELGGQP
jgi:excisionase family DNA binding protein